MFDVAIFHDQGGRQKKESLDPYLAEMLAQRRIWAVKRPKRLPLSGEMLEQMFRFASTARSQYGDWHMDCVLWDTIVVGTYGGCRLGEYGQSRFTAPKQVQWPAGLPY